MRYVLFFLAILLPFLGKAQFDLSVDTLILQSPEVDSLSYGDTARFEFTVRVVSTDPVPAGTDLRFQFTLSDGETFDLSHTTASALNTGDELTLPVPPFVMFKGDSIIFCLSIVTVDASDTNNVFCEKLWVAPPLSANLNPAEDSWQVYVFNGVCTVTPPAPGDYVFSVYDLQGRELEHRAFRNEIQLSTRAWNASMVIYHIHSEQGPQSGKLFIR